MAAAIGSGTRILVTHDVKHFRSGEGVLVRRPREFVADLREFLAGFGGRRGRRDVVDTSRASLPAESRR
jgi:hypothetical protein